MRRVLIVLIGLLLAVVAGMLFLAIGGLAFPATREFAADLTITGVVSTLGALATADSPDRVWGVFVVAFWTLTAALLVLPPLVSALVGEAAGVRSFVWYAGCAGLLTAALAWWGHASGQGPDRAEMSLLTLLFLTGAVSGLVYWAVAGRAAGQPTL
jgi:hypothetical protein